LRFAERRDVEAAAIALLALIAIGSVLILIAGASPGRVWWTMLDKTATDPSQLGLVLYKATGLALCGLAVALALDAGLFNIGGEAQITAGIGAGAGIGGSPANASLVLVAVVTAGMWWLRSATTWGRAWRALGEDPAAARSVGIDVGRVQILVMAGSGAIAGLAASNFVLGNQHAFEE